MTPADVKVYLDGDDAAFEKAVADLEAQGLVMVIRNKKGVQLVKANYNGLNKAYPKEYYQWAPEYITKENGRFF
jgi:hypothetical protein